MRRAAPQTRRRFSGLRRIGSPGCRLRRGGRFEARLDLPHELGRAGLVERLRRPAVQVGGEAVGIVAHPGEQASCGLGGVGARCLPGPDPAAEELADELAEATARVVDLLGFLVAAREEGLVERDRAGRLGRDEPLELSLDLPQLPNEIETGAVSHEPPRRERRLDGAFEGIDPGTRLAAHRVPRFAFALAPEEGLSCSSNGMALKLESSPWWK